MIYAIGLPGQPVRIFLQTPHIQDVEAQLGQDEIWVEAPVIGAFIITWEGELAERPVSLEEARTARWHESKLYRESRMNGGCATALGRVDTDEASRTKISGAVQMAMLAKMSQQAFSVSWTMSDNSVVAHDADAMIAMGLAVGQHVQACQDAGTAIRSQINAAGSVEGFADIDITSGYPA